MKKSFSAVPVAPAVMRVARVRLKEIKNKNVS